MAEDTILSRLPVKGATKTSAGVADAGKVPMLGATGTLDPSVIPPSGVFSVFTVADEAARVALVAEVGDIAKQADNQRSYVLQTLPASVEGNWIQLTPELINPPYSYIADNDLLVSGGSYLADTTAGAISCTLPATPLIGDCIQIIDPSTSWGTNSLTVERSGNLISELDEDLVADVSAYITLVFVGGLVGWRLLPNATFENFILPQDINLKLASAPAHNNSALSVPYEAGTQYLAFSTPYMYFYTGDGSTHSWLKFLGSNSF